jgi:hypothetical protein
MSVIGYLWRIAWFNPYTEPPNGQRVLAEMFVLRVGKQGARKPPELEGLAPLGSGYGICVQAICEPLKGKPPEFKAAVRQRNLRRRMTSKYPLFADQFSQAQIDADPEYFLEGKSSGDQAREEILQQEREQFEYLLKNAGKLIVYFTPTG